MVSYRYWVCLLNPELVVKREEYIDETPKLLREVELIQYENIMVNICHCTFAKHVECITPRANSGVTYGLRGTVACQCRLIDWHMCHSVDDGRHWFLFSFLWQKQLKVTVHQGREGLLAGLASSCPWQQSIRLFAVFMADQELEHTSWNWGQAINLQGLTPLHKLPKQCY